MQQIQKIGRHQQHKRRIGPTAVLAALVVAGCGGGDGDGGSATSLSTTAQAQASNVKAACSNRVNNTFDKLLGSHDARHLGCRCRAVNHAVRRAGFQRIVKSGFLLNLILLPTNQTD